MGRVAASLHNANPFTVQITRLTLWEGPVELGRSTACHLIPAGAVCRMTVVLSAPLAESLRRLGHTAVDVVLCARAPAGDSARAVERALLRAGPALMEG